MSAPAKALTIRQPWAWAIARGCKTIENRTWTTTYRGPILIHAAQRWDDDEIGALRTVVRLAREQGYPVPSTPADDLPYFGVGHLIAVAQLADICAAGLGDVSCDCGPWALPGHAHWRLADAQPLAEAVPARGSLGLWHVTLGDVALAAGGAR